MSLLHFHPEPLIPPGAEEQIDALWRTTLLKWIVPTVVAIIAFTDLAVTVAHAENVTAKPDEVRVEKIATANGAALAIPTAAMTTFMDGPTGFIFVYTAEGWKFVRGSGAN